MVTSNQILYSSAGLGILFYTVLVPLAKLEVRRVGITFRYRYKAEPYCRAVERCGLEPVLLGPEEPPQDLASLDGLLLSGGRDVNPARYGQERDSRTAEPDEKRDDFETGLLLDSLSRSMPILAICRGMQLLNVALGGTLHQHIEAHEVRTKDPSEPVHAVEVSAGTELRRAFERACVRVNSRHHQAIDRMGAGLTVSAVAGDGTIEAIEYSGAPFVIGVQWHPEDQVERCPVQASLFSAFAQALSRRMTA